MPGNQTSGEPTRVRVTSPAEVLSIVPLILGYQPAVGDTIVVGLADTGRMVSAVRFDAQGARAIPAGQMRTILANVRSVGVRSAIVIGYGTDVTPAVDRVRGLVSAQMPVRDALRADGNRYWSYQCDNLECCPPEGREYAAESQASTLLRAEAGLTAAPSRQQIADSIAAPAGEHGEAARLAWNQALAEPQTYQDARASVARAVADCQQGRLPSTGQAARLAGAVTSLPVRDYAWALSAREHAQHHTELWKSVVRSVPAEAAAAPASLLAFTAWQAGDGALANAAIDRALDARPGYSMAQLIGEAVSAGVPPEVAEPPMTPAEVEAAYGLAQPQTGDPAADREAG
jgi:hypothetical protein